MKTLFGNTITAIAIFFSLTIFSCRAEGPSTNTTQLRIQLMGPIQAQFAGLYIAQSRSFFKNQGLNVEIIPSGPSTNPIKELQLGEVDIAISWLANAQDADLPNQNIVNFAQIFNSSSLRLVCKVDRGIYSAADLRNKSIGVQGNGDKKFVESLLRINDISEKNVKFHTDSAQNLESNANKYDCITSNSYSNYATLINQDLAASNTIEFFPKDIEYVNIEDGLYVLRSRLSSPEFQTSLAGFLTALRQGWSVARKSPNLAVEVVLQHNPMLSRSEQRYMLEQVLQLMPEDSKKFGLLDISQFNQGYENGNMIWTHKIWEKINESGFTGSLTTNANSYYMKLVTTNHYYKLIFYFGVFAFALSGILEAIDRSYDLYGRLFLGLLSGLGGSTLRDFLIQGDRMPLYYIKDVTYPLGIFALVIIATIITGLYPEFHKGKAFKEIKKYVDIIGFSLIAITGAVISLTSGLPWFWAPFCAALSCSGGGVLRDIVVNQEPSAFKKTVYEEPAVIGAFVLILGLYLSGPYEHSVIPVALSIFISIILVIMMRIAVYRYSIQYPRWLGGPSDIKK